MDDLGEALNVNPNLLFMGGGNPAAIPEAEAIYQRALKNIADNPATLRKVLGTYQSPQGDPNLLKELAIYFNKQLGWSLSAKNIAIANGSQSAFSVLFNLFAGEYQDGINKKVELPLVPEYVGYADLGLAANFFNAHKPTIELLDDHCFKYHVDLDHLTVGSDSGLLCVSRPTNPTGNVLTDKEVERLASLAENSDIPLLIDGAYGTPFPNIIFTNAKAYWSDNTILVLSLSKLGLPGARAGIVVAHPDIIDAFTRANTILNLASGNIGPALLSELLKDDLLNHLSNEIIQPYYKTSVEQACHWMQEAFVGLPFRYHKPEGAFFLWLWFKDLPITSRELYQRLKQRGLLVLAGEDFFVGLGDAWQHQYECLRLTYCQEPRIVKQGIELIADEVRSLYRQ
jgi:valine--pyruvate aminotransferase